MKTARQVAIEMLTAAEAGKTVQCRPLNEDHWRDMSPQMVGESCEGGFPNFSLDRYEWRVKPEPRTLWALYDSAGNFQRIYHNEPDRGSLVRSYEVIEFREVLD